SRGGAPQGLTISCGATDSSTQSVGGVKQKGIPTTSTVHPPLVPCRAPASPERRGILRGPFNVGSERNEAAECGRGDGDRDRDPAQGARGRRRDAGATADCWPCHHHGGSGGDRAGGPAADPGPTRRLRRGALPGRSGDGPAPAPYHWLGQLDQEQELGPAD